jgi:hypothetical protein
MIFQQEKMNEWETDEWKFTWPVYLISTRGNIPKPMLVFLYKKENKYYVCDGKNIFNRFKILKDAKNSNREDIVRIDTYRKVVFVGSISLLSLNVACTEEEMKIRVQESISVMYDIIGGMQDTYLDTLAVLK